MVGRSFRASGPGQTIELIQTESAHFKLDGLVLGLVSFDDKSGIYRMRAFNDGPLA